METQVLEVSHVMEAFADGEKPELTELTNLQLAVAGGGCAEVCPY